MLTEQTLKKLIALRLTTMADAWEAQQRDASIHDLSFDDRFGLLVDAEHLARENRRIARNMKQANLRIVDASLEDLKTGPSRGLDKAQVRQLQTCRWVRDHQNVLVSGPTGVGKSYLACALGQAAVRHGYRVGFRRIPRLFEELALARAEGTYAKLMADLRKRDVLILDDLGLALPKSAQKHDLLEVLEDRDGQASTVVTSQLPVKKWYEWLDDATLADAILDRLVHGAYKFELKGESQRKTRANPS